MANTTNQRWVKRKNSQKKRATMVKQLKKSIEYARNIKWILLESIKYSDWNVIKYHYI